MLLRRVAHAFPVDAILVVGLLVVGCGGAGAGSAPRASSSDGPRSPAGEATSSVRRHGPEVDALVEAALAGRHRGWPWLETLCVEIGHRLSGSPGLARAVDFVASELATIDGVRVERQPVQVPHWTRGDESLALVRPDAGPLEVLGLGGTVATPPDGLEGDVVVVRSFDELEERGDEVAGKVVLFDVPMPPYDEEAHMPGYGAVVGYRVHGPGRAAAHGATAVLLRSLTNDPDSPPHTGMTRYPDEGPRIPAAAITLPDADRIARLVDTGERVTVRLVTSGRDHGEAPSHNVIGELRGEERPDEIVVIGGHLDSWDVGQGCHDDASGVVSAMAALELLAGLERRPRRTVRVVAWTNEENGLRGARAYAEERWSDGRHVAGVESDIGAAPVIGLQVQAEDAGRQAVALGQLAELAEMLEPVGVRFARASFSGADLSPLRERGMPGVGLLHDPAHYFDLHHTRVDTFEAVDPRAFAQGVAVMAATTHVLAAMSPPLGHPSAPRPQPSDVRNEPPETGGERSESGGEPEGPSDVRFEPSGIGGERAESGGGTSGVRAR